MNGRSLPSTESTCKKMAACTAVFATYELMEDIISYLPSSQINKCQRVLKHWHTVIRGSAAIARTRCIWPVAASELKPLEPKELASRKWQPGQPMPSGRWKEQGLRGRSMLVAKLDPLIVIEEHVLNGLPHYNRHQRIQFHPELRAYSESNSILQQHRSVNMMLQLPMTTSVYDCERLKNVYATEPPCTTMWLDVRYPAYSSRQYSLATGKVHVPSGVKFGDLMKEQKALFKAKLPRMRMDEELPCFAMVVINVNVAALRLAAEGTSAVLRS